AAAVRGACRIPEHLVLRETSVCQLNLACREDIQPRLRASRRHGPDAVSLPPTANDVLLPPLERAPRSAARNLRAPRTALMASRICFAPPTPHPAPPTGRARPCRPQNHRPAQSAQTIAPAKSPCEFPHRST